MWREIRSAIAAWRWKLADWVIWAMGEKTVVSRRIEDDNRERSFGSHAPILICCHRTRIHHHGEVFITQMARKTKRNKLPNRLTISLAKHQRRQLVELAEAEQSSVAFVVRKAVDTYLQARPKLAAANNH
jgi:hypothetical protein